METNNEITLYHGTTKEAGEQILKCGQIEGSDINQITVNNTESGYVFFSDTLGVALHYGSFKQSGNETRPRVPFYVFKLKMSKDMLVDDIYEIDHMKKLGYDFKSKFYKIKGDVALVNHDCKYAKITNVGIVERMHENLNTLTNINTAYFHGDFTTVISETKLFEDGNNILWKAYKNE